MKKPIQIIIIILGVVVVLFGVWFTDNFVYPLKADKPNYSDVEKAFAQLQFPADWKEIGTSENRGMHGRGCNPFNDSGCFHKTKIFQVSDAEIAKNKIKDIFKTVGCSDVQDEPTYEGNSNTSPKTAANLSCRLQNGVTLGASTSQLRGEVSVGASTN